MIKDNIAKGLWLNILEGDLWKIDWMLYKNTIWVNKKLYNYEKRFVIAHEICHFLLSEKSFSKWIYHSLNPMEKREDSFQAKLLVPIKQIKDLYIEHENIPTLVDIFEVPEKVIEKELNNIFCKV